MTFTVNCNRYRHSCYLALSYAPTFWVVLRMRRLALLQQVTWRSRDTASAAVTYFSTTTSFAIVPCFENSVNERQRRGAERNRLFRGSITAGLSRHTSGVNKRHGWRAGLGRITLSVWRRSQSDSGWSSVVYVNSSWNERKVHSVHC